MMLTRKRESSVFSRRRSTRRKQRCGGTCTGTKRTPEGNLRLHTFKLTVSFLMVALGSHGLGDDGLLVRNVILADE